MTKAKIDEQAPASAKRTRIDVFRELTTAGRNLADLPVEVNQPVAPVGCR
jgi:hypothetical protein